jgi:hypothetical protein
MSKEGSSLPPAVCSWNSRRSKDNISSNRHGRSLLGRDVQSSHAPQFVERLHRTKQPRGCYIFRKNRNLPRSNNVYAYAQITSHRILRGVSLGRLCSRW